MPERRSSGRRLQDGSRNQVPIFVQALLAAQAVIGMRDSQEIGDDAFRQVEADLDWMEMSESRNEDLDRSR
jgi:hypothetical protein